jgi:hypothetical protein
LYPVRYIQVKKVTVLKKGRSWFLAAGRAIPGGRFDLRLCDEIRRVFDRWDG